MTRRTSAVVILALFALAAAPASQPATQSSPADADQKVIAIEAMLKSVPAEFLPERHGDSSSAVNWLTKRYAGVNVLMTGTVGKPVVSFTKKGASVRIGVRLDRVKQWAGDDARAGTAISGMVSEEAAKKYSKWPDGRRVKFVAPFKTCRIETLSGEGPQGPNDPFWHVVVETGASIQDLE